ncbi:MAG: hypothetical protein ACRDBP_05385 [Luteolibacter sp.]
MKITLIRSGSGFCSSDFLPAEQRVDGKTGKAGQIAAYDGGGLYSAWLGG